MTVSGGMTPAMRRLTAQREAATAKLQEDLLHHLWSEFPQHCIVLTDPQTRTCVLAAIDGAKRHGATKFPAVRAYATLMVFLGHRFVDDPMHPWASTTLQANRGEPEARAMGRLQATAADELARVVGDEGQYYRRALMWARSKSFDSLVDDYIGRGEEGLREFLRALLATRYSALGARGVTELLARASDEARRHGILGPEGRMVVAGLMFLLGAGFADDPFYPRLASAIEQARHHDLGARVLYTAAIDELERFLRLDRVRRRA